MGHSKHISDPDKFNETNAKQKHAIDTKTDDTWGKQCQRSRSERAGQALQPMGMTCLITCGLIRNPAISPVPKSSHQLEDQKMCRICACSVPSGILKSRETRG